MSDPIKSTDILGMSDDEFLDQMPSLPKQDPVVQEPSNTDPVITPAEPVITPTETPTDPSLGSNPENPGAEVKTDPVEVKPADPKVEPNSGNVTPELTPKQDAPGAQPNPNPTATPAGENGQKTDPAAVTPSTAVNYEAEYKRLMAPIKANGKMIELRTPDELIQLAQMGANYTRKMQDIAPHRKVLLMLQNNGLLDEGKLSFLIDIEKKNPEAIKKLLKDSGINPLDIDTESQSQYQANSHAVSDAEANFHAVLGDLNSHEAGQKTIQAIHAGWDDASKQQLWIDPSVMTIIHEQRESGIYDRIAAEIDRRRTMGLIPVTTPFLQAYKLVGDDMLAKGGFNDLIKPPAVPATPAAQPAAVTPATPVATRVVAPKPQVTNGEQANAAASTRSTSRKAEPFVNPLSMSDDEFMKQMANRL